MSAIRKNITIPLVALTLVFATPVVNAHDVRNHSAAGHYDSSHQGSNRGGPFVDRANSLAESAIQFRRVVDSRVGHYGDHNRDHKLLQNARRYAHLANELAGTRRGDRDRRLNIIEGMRKTAGRIDRRIDDFSHRRKLVRSWRHTRMQLVNLVEFVSDRRDHGNRYSHNNNNNYSGWTDGRDHDGRYHNGWKNNNHNGRKHNNQNGKHFGNGSNRYNQGAVDIVEDSSERTKNAFNSFLHAHKRLAKAGWARSLRGELSAFDQAANRLRDAVKRGGRRDASQQALRELRQRRDRIDHLMSGQNVGNKTRNHWTTVRNALGQLGRA